MRPRFALIAAVVASLVAPSRAESQNRFDWRPGVMIPIGLDVNGGIGTWGSRVGLIVGKVTDGDGDFPRAFGALVLAEGATNEYSAIGVGVGFAGGFSLGPIVPIPMVAGRVTVNRAHYNPYRNNTRRTATGVSVALTYPILSYGLTLYREEAQAGLNANWQWRVSLGIGF